MSATTEELRLIIKAKDEASRTLRGVGDSTGKLGKGFEKLKKLAIGAAVAGVAVLTTAVLKFADEVDKAYDSIRIGTGKTGKALQGLQDDLKAVVRDVPTDFATAADAITEINRRLGLTDVPLQKLTKHFLDLSRLTGTDVTENIRLGTRLFGDWSIASGKQGDALDLLFRATQKSGIGLGELMETVVSFGAPLRNMGFGFSESVAMLAKWEKEGVNTGTVLTGMKFALKTFAKAGDDPQKALAKLIPKMRDMKDEQAAMTLGMKTFGLRAGPDMVAAIREGRFEYADFQKVIEKGRDTVARAAKDTDGWRESLTKLKNRALVAAEPTLNKVTAGLDKLAKRLGDATSTREFKQGMEIVKRVLHVAGEALTWLWEQYQTYFFPVFKDAAETVRAWVEFFQRNWDTIGPIVEGALKAVKIIVTTVLKVVSSHIRMILALIRGDFGAFDKHLRALWKALWDGLKALAKLGGQLLAGAVRLIWDGIKSAASSVWDGIVGVVASAWDRIAGYINKIIGAFNWVINKVPGLDGKNIPLLNVGGGGGGKTGNPRGPAGDPSAGPRMGGGGKGFTGRKDVAAAFPGKSPGGLFGGALSWLLGAVKGAVWKLVKSSVLSAVGVGGKGYAWASGLAQRFGLSVSSTYRPGAITAAGFPSDHGVYGRAADIAGPPGAMAALWDYVRETAGSWKQAIYGHQMINYGKLGYYGPSDHFDHVHLARKGDDSRRPASSGGRQSAAPSIVVEPAPVYVYLDSEPIAARVEQRRGMRTWRAATVSPR